MIAEYTQAAIIYGLNQLEYASLTRMGGGMLK
jgi:hypothetical protein